jgi:Di-haem oxidoreductase, putative peroxidase
MRRYDALMSSLGLLLFTSFASLSAPKALSQNVSGGADHVFGDSLPHLSEKERAEFDQGYRLFIKVWDLGYGQRRSVNSLTCVGCHMEPMPGGSGTAAKTFVIVARSSSDIAGGHVFQRFLVDAGSTQSQAIPAGYTLRKTPPLFGLGLLEEVSNQQSDKGRSAPFGWRGGTKSLYDFVERAIAVELGLDTPKFHHNDASRSTSTSLQAVSLQQIQQITQYLRLLGPPRPKDAGFLNLPGFRIFENLGCAGCHTPASTTGDAEVQALSHQTIFPFTDLHTHDMGPKLSDCEDETPPHCSRFRTPPLWGLSSTGPPFLHDGRAKTLEESLLAHGGEAIMVTHAYQNLDDKNRQLLLEFLNAL